jgi:hypothetical protein
MDLLRHDGTLGMIAIALAGSAGISLRESIAEWSWCSRFPAIAKRLFKGGSRDRAAAA